MQARNIFLLNKLQKYTYLLLLFFLPTQLGKHFWPSFSFVSGLRVDYLSPTLFVTDILLASLFLLFVIAHPLRFPLRISISKKNNFILLFSLILFGGLMFSKSPAAGLFGIIKLLEVSFFGYYTARFLGKTITYASAAISITTAITIQSLLAVTQFFTHSSVNGLFYFIGERTFTMLTPGIANASIGGTLILRPYGTLPHPNVLAAYLLLSVLFVVGTWQQFRSKAMRSISALVGGIACFALFLTLSRTVLFVFFFLLAYLFMQLVGKRMSTSYTLGILGIAVVVALGIFYTPILGRFTSSSFLEESFLIREDLTKNALWMLYTHPFFGVGIENFLQNLPPSSSSTFSYYSLLQPVHTIYLLVFAQVGVVGGILFLYFLFCVGKTIVRRQESTLQKATLVMFSSVVFLGLFDHYFLTVQQGQLVFAFVIGLAFSLPRNTSSQKKTT